MRLIVDANILFAALIKNSATADILFDETIDINVPDLFFAELERNAQVIRAKSNRENYDETLAYLLKRIHRHPPSTLHPHWVRARQTCPDPKDTPYFALALALSCPFWTAERGLERQDVVRIVRTVELLERA